MGSFRKNVKKELKDTHKNTVKSLALVEVNIDSLSYEA